jgi:hypothetical protein
MGGVQPEEWDAFHEMILLDELSRCGSGGVVWGLQEGLAIGLPPILHFGSRYLKDKVAGYFKQIVIIKLIHNEN